MQRLAKVGSIVSKVGLLRRLYAGTSRVVLQVDIVERTLLVLALFV